MNQLISKAFYVSGIALAVGLVQCGSSSSGDAGSTPRFAPPNEHFSAAPACRSTRAAGSTFTFGDGGSTCGGALTCCQSDADCTSGNNGRCSGDGRAGPHCDYDECFTNADCPSSTSSCACGDLDPSSNNICVPSNCHTDSDCGSNGFCSPSLSEQACGTVGYGGIYCHTASDECHNDSDCSASAGLGPNPVCLFSTAGAKWICGGVICAG